MAIMNSISFPFPIRGLWLLGMVAVGWSIAERPARADGGIPLLVERVDDYEVAVFASPAPLRVGPLDISVLVQNAGTGTPSPVSEIRVRLQSGGPYRVALEETATTEAATNKLFRAAHFELPSAGDWKVRVQIDDDQETLTVDGTFVAGEPRPRWRALWPWFTWPIIPIAVFLLRQRAQIRLQRGKTLHQRD